MFFLEKKTQKIVLLGYLLIHILIQLLKYIRDKSQLRIYILIIFVLQVRINITNTQRISWPKRIYLLPKI